MKKRNFITTICLFACLICALLMLASCGDRGVKTPTNLKIDWDHNLSWNDVANARIYYVEIKNTETGEVVVRQTRKETQPLASYAEGVYEIKVRAVSGDNESSDWSEVITFNRPYETGCVYELVNNSEYHIVKVGRAAGKIYIEDEYRNRPVTAIAESAFKNSSRITDVVIGKNVKSIGEKAFYNCRNLVSVTNLDSVTSIGNAAFQGCTSLTEFTVPDAITSIGEYTFAYCRSLKNIEIGKNVTSIGFSAFSDCTGLTTVTIPDGVTALLGETFMGNTSLETVNINKKLQAIGEYDFSYCTSLKNVVFPQDSELTSIGSYAFTETTSLESIALPEGLESIGSYAFLRCDKLASIDIPSSVNKIGIYAFYSSKLYLDQYTAGEPLIYADDWLIDCSPLIRAGYQIEGEKVTRPVGLSSEEDSSQIDTVETVEYKEMNVILKDGVVGIANDAMRNCAFLKIVILPESVKYIGDGGFENCPVLWKVETKAVEVIGTMAFYKCPLTNVQLGEGLERIDNYAFYETKIKYETFKLPESLRSIGNEAFFKTPLWNEGLDSYGVRYADNWVIGQSLKPSIGADDGVFCDIVLKEGTVGIADYAFYSDMASGNISGMFLTSIYGIENVKHIGRSAFYSCLQLSSVVLNDEIEHIEDYTFYQCINLVNVDLPSSLKSIGRSAFYQTAFTSIDLSECQELESIDRYAFFGCYELETLNLGESVKEIGDYAFYQSAITELTLPNSVKSLGVRSFYKNANLKNITFGSGIESIASYAFSGCTALEEIVLPETVVSVENNAFYGCTAVKKLDLGKVKTIGKYAFFGLENLESLVVPETVEYIAGFAFKGAGYSRTTEEGKIDGVVLRSDINIDAHAFYGMNKTTFYTSATEQPSNWINRWNSSYRPVFFGCEIKTEDGTPYVNSITVSSKTLINKNAKNGITAPEREGYTFEGWATTENGSVSYLADEVIFVDEGTVLYAVWTKDVE